MKSIAQNDYVEIKLAITSNRQYTIELNGHGFDKVLKLKCATVDKKITTTFYFI